LRPLNQGEIVGGAIREIPECISNITELHA